MTIKNIIFILVGLIIIAGGTFYMKSSPKNDISKNEANSSSSQTPPQDEIVFNGEGRKIVGPVTLKNGLVIIKAKNQSGPNSTFSVNVYADANENGTFESDEEYSGFTGSNISVGYENAEVFNGALAFKSDGGKYFIDVDGGRWQITLIPSEKLTEPAPAPSNFSGKGIQVTNKFYLPAGEYSFRATNEGGGNFIIKMVDENGNSTGRLVNQTYDYEGDFTVKNVFDGNYVFTVMGGDWTIEKN